jgi:hypothetical protein
MNGELTKVETRTADGKVIIWYMSLQTVKVELVGFEKQLTFVGIAVSPVMAEGDWEARERESHGI